MVTKAYAVLMDLMWRHPRVVAAGVGMLCVLGIVVGASVSVLTRRGKGTRQLTTEGWLPALALVAFCVGDGALLWVLPRLRLSFSTQIMPSLVTSLIIRLLVFWILLAAAALAHWRGRRRGVAVQSRSAIILFLAINLAFTAVQVDAYVLEPLLVETNKLGLAFDDLDPAAPAVRVVHLTDPHIERASFREARTVREVNELKPDIIVLTGDYLNLSRLSDPTSAAQFRAFVSQLKAPYGIYAVRGSVEPTLESMAWLVRGTDVVWLEQEAVTVDVRGQPITLVGVACSHGQALDATRLEQAMEGIPADALTVLLYHSPDLIHEAAGHHVDLYLGGHTHGGQLRLPIYGAIVTGSIYGKRYTAGLFEQAGTSMYISRGLGFEGGGMPRARFLCRPEIVSLELTGR